MTKDSKKKGKTAKEKREENTKIIKDTISAQFKRTSPKGFTHGLGFFAMAYIIKKGLFDPFKTIFDVDMDTAGGQLELAQGIAAAGKTAVGGAGGLGALPFEIGKRLGEALALEVAKKNKDGSDKTQDQKDSLIAEALSEANLTGWMIGFAGAWAVGKFLSETTITELAEAIPLIQ